LVKEKETRGLVLGTEKENRERRGAGLSPASTVLNGRYRPRKKKIIFKEIFGQIRFPRALALDI